ncbi:hypothetical protein QU38_02315, partial [Staphylococcus aureus]
LCAQRLPPCRAAARAASPLLLGDGLCRDCPGGAGGGAGALSRDPRPGGAGRGDRRLAPVAGRRTVRRARFGGLVPRAQPCAGRGRARAGGDRNADRRGRRPPAVPRGAEPAPAARRSAGDDGRGDDGDVLILVRPTIGEGAGAGPRALPVSRDEQASPHPRPCRLPAPRH